MDDKYWYSSEDIDVLLKQYMQNEKQTKYEIRYPPIDTEDSLSIVLTISKGYTSLKNGELDVMIIPVNIGRSHWTGLVLKKNEKGSIEAHYNDSFGRTMTDTIPVLYDVLKIHNIDDVNIIDHKTRQQNNGYDCGPWTVFNLQSMAQGGQLQGQQADIKGQREELFNIKNSEIYQENHKNFTEYAQANDVVEKTKVQQENNIAFKANTHVHNVIVKNPESNINIESKNSIHKKLDEKSLNRLEKIEKKLKKIVSKTLPEKLSKAVSLVRQKVKKTFKTKDKINTR